MWSEVIVLLSPTRDQDFGFFQGEEDLPIEQFIAQFNIELIDEHLCDRYGQYAVICDLALWCEQLYLGALWGVVLSY